MRAIFRILRLWGDARAASRGPEAIARRYVSRRAHRGLARTLRRTWR